MPDDKKRGGLVVMMPGLWYEEFELGAVVEHDGELQVSQEDNEAFCRLTRNRQPLHLDRDAALAQGFRDVLVNGLYTFSASVGMSVGDLTEGTLVANLGYEEVRHPAPVFPGDRLRVRSTILEKRESSKPGRGIVQVGHEVRNQDGVVVCSYQRTVMVRTRPTS